MTSSHVFWYGEEQLNVSCKVSFIFRPSSVVRVANESIGVEFIAFELD